jgi:hypothetical protein
MSICQEQDTCVPANIDVLVDGTTNPLPISEVWSMHVLLCMQPTTKGIHEPRQWIVWTGTTIHIRYGDQHPCQVTKTCLRSHRGVSDKGSKAVIDPCLQKSMAVPSQKNHPHRSSREHYADHLSSNISSTLCCGFTTFLNAVIQLQPIVTQTSTCALPLAPSSHQM